MALSELLKATAAAEDLDAAEAIAAMLNADVFFRAKMSGATHFKGADVIRFGQTLAAYLPNGLPKVGTLGVASDTARQPVDAVADGLGIRRIDAGAQ